MQCRCGSPALAQTARNASPQSRLHQGTRLQKPRPRPGPPSRAKFPGPPAAAAVTWPEVWRRRKETPLEGGGEGVFAFRGLPDVVAGALHSRTFLGPFEASPHRRWRRRRVLASQCRGPRPWRRCGGCGELGAALGCGWPGSDGMAAAGGGAAAGRAYSFKVVLLGEGCVGKTSLVLRYCENKFNDKHITTLQVRGPESGRWRPRAPACPGPVRTLLPWSPGLGLTHLRPGTSAF